MWGPNVTLHISREAKHTNAHPLLNPETNVTICWYHANKMVAWALDLRRWSIMNSLVALASFPYVQFGQFKVCNNKCELKVGKWARMNNSNENGNFLWVPLQKFEHFNRTYVVIRIPCNTQYSSAIKSFGWKKIFSQKFMNAVEIPAVGAVPFHVAFHHARPQDSPVSNFLNLGKVARSGTSIFFKFV